MVNIAITNTQYIPQSYVGCIKLNAVIAISYYYL